MNKNSGIYHRRSIRLKNYDYSSCGIYFVTIDVLCHRIGLGKIVDEKIVLNDNGKIVEKYWCKLPKYYGNIDLGEFIIMPTHVHGVLIIKDRVNKSGLPDIIRSFKSFTSREINYRQKMTGNAYWQRNYYERIIRNELELENASNYIINNPKNRLKK